MDRLDQTEFRFETFLQNAGKIDMSSFCSIVQPAGNGKRFFDRLKLLLIFDHIKRNHYYKIAGINR